VSREPRAQVRPALIPTGYKPSPMLDHGKPAQQTFNQATCPRDPQLIYMPRGIL